MTSPARGSGRRILRAAGGAVCLLAAATCAPGHGRRAADPAAAVESCLDDLLGRRVRDGLVDYAGLKDDAALASCIDRIARMEPPIQGSQQRAWWINAWNAFALKAVTDRWPLAGLREVSPTGRETFFRDLKFEAGGHDVSLDFIEHKMLRAGLEDPRIHFALAWPALGGPRLRPSAFHADRLDEELEEAARSFVSDGAKVRLDREQRILHLSPIFEWYGEDFERRGGSIPSWIARYASREDAEILTGEPVTVKWLDFDWSLNDAGRAPPRAAAPGI